MLAKSLASACAIAILAFAPLAGSAGDKMMAPKKPHQCRDAKGHFVKGKYVKCPAGTHKAM